jgi:ribonucleoside-diphosphate reductase beta chain
MTIATTFTPTPTSVFKVRDKSPADVKIFLDEAGAVDISRSDIVKYPIFKKQADAMLANFWKPQEIVLTKDGVDFNQNMDDNERFIFTSNLKSQVIMDSIQSMALSQAFLPICSDPAVKRCIVYMDQQESVHDDSYQHIIRNVYNDPTAVFDEMTSIEPLVNRGKSVAAYYDRQILTIAKYRLGLCSIDEVKRSTWLCLNAVNALEGLRFMQSFSVAFCFGNLGKMQGNASIIKLIASDELLHQAFTTALIRTLPEDDEDYIAVREECLPEVEHIFMETVDQEKAFSKFTFQNGSLIGLNEAISYQYLDFMAAKRMRAIGMTYKNESPRTNPLPWMAKYLNEGTIQVAPQEQEITAYQQNTIADVSSDTFVGFDL